MLPHFALLALLPTLLLPTLSSPLRKRDPGDPHELLYLCDCEKPDGSNKTSQLAYYLDWTVAPGTPAIGKAPLPSRVAWENSTQQMSLRPDIIDRQTVAINPYADALPPRAFAGVMNTTSGLYLPCFRDADQYVYTDVGGARCISHYFCIDVSLPSEKLFLFSFCGALMRRTGRHVRRAGHMLHAAVRRSQLDVAGELEFHVQELENFVSARDLAIRELGNRKPKTGGIELVYIESASYYR